MSPIPAQAETRAELEDKAADFLQRRRFGAWGKEEQDELDAWLSAAEARRIVFWRLEATLARVETLSALRMPQPKRGRILPRLRFVVPIFALAAALGAIAVYGPEIVSYLLQPPDRTYSTDVGGRTLLTFSDSTQIELNTNTAVRYRMTTAERVVWLEKGEAWFHVAHDAKHPFTVIAGNHRVRDVGTEFVVRRGAGATDVALLSGRATLSTDGAQTAMLVPGDEAVATRDSMAVTRKTPQELADELGWRRGVLVFRNTRLADAVAEFNRYNATKLVIADPSIADVKVSAEVKTQNYEGFLKLAQTVLDLRIDREGNDILISRNRKSESGSRKSEAKSRASTP